MTNFLPVFPQLRWNDRDYATLKARLHLFDDYLLMEKFDEAGRPGEMYIVDPVDIASRMMGTAGLTSGLLPPGCLFYGTAGGQEVLAVYVAPKTWPVSVEGKKLTWHIPMPGLVVMGQGQGYHILAVKETGWPGPETQLYNAPCPNLGSRGVCRGNVSFPVASADTILQAVEVFFGSGFNDDLSNNKSLAHRGSVLEQWRELNRARATTYPLDDLVKSNLTLAGLLKGNVT